MTPITTFISSNPIIGGILDAFDVYDALTSADSIDAFKEILRKKALGKLSQKLGKSVERLTGSETEGIDSAIESAADLWGKQKKDQRLTTETFQYGPFGDCDAIVFGSWFRGHNGRVIITIQGDCKCKYHDIGKFVINVFGEINYEMRNGVAVTAGSYTNSKSYAECPCSKNTAFIINQPDGYYTYIKDYVTETGKDGISIPPQVATLLKGADKVAMVIDTENDKKDNILVALTLADDKVKVNSIERTETAPTAALTVKTSEYTINNILLSKNKLAAFTDAFNSGKFKVKSNKPATSAAVAVANFGSKVYAGFNSGKYEVAQGQQVALTYLGNSATLTKTPTNLRIVTPTNAQYSTVINRYGTPQGYTTTKTNVLLSYNSNRYTPSAGVYSTSPVAIQNHYNTPSMGYAVGSYGGASVAFAAGRGSVGGGRTYARIG